jgi:hypothetical protein|tara:strand:+ start:2939 stop:3814 length:876 start_codon:yes stop_codon:yes gene_type:complete
MYKKYNSENYLFEGQSAGNLSLGTSETLRPGSLEYVAGVIDGNGNFGVRALLNGERKLLDLRIGLPNRDLRVLTKVKIILKCGHIKTDKNRSIYRITKKSELERVVRLLNGHIRLKVLSFMEACEYLRVPYVMACYVISENSPYFSGLIDTCGSISYNYSNNSIVLFLEFKQNSYSEKLNLDNAVPGYQPKVYKKIKRNQTKDKIFYSVRFEFSMTSKMIHLYDFVMKSRVYSDFKFYRFSQIKSFLQVRHFQKFPKKSSEHIAYSQWVFNFISYLNPNYNKVVYISELSL